MSEARGNMGIASGGQRVLPGGTVYAPRQLANRGLTDHSGWEILFKRIVP